MCTGNIADKNRLALILGFSTLLGQPLMKAQAAKSSLIADIPFSFQVGFCTMPAGTYAVDVKGNDVLSIKGESGVAAMLVMWAATGRDTSDSAVIFHRYGDKYFLREVRTAGNQAFLWSGETKSERRAKLEQDAANPNSVPREDRKVEITLLTPPR